MGFEGKNFQEMGYIHVYDLYSQTSLLVFVYLRSQVSLYRTIGPLVLNFTLFACILFNVLQLGTDEADRYLSGCNNCWSGSTLPVLELCEKI